MNDSTKISTIKINRNPRFTRGLDDTTLDNLEAWAYQVVTKMCISHPGVNFEKFTDVDLWGWINPDYCKAYELGFTRDDIKTDNEWAYLQSTINYILVVAQSKRFMGKGSSNHSKAWYAERRNGYN